MSHFGFLLGGLIFLTLLLLALVGAILSIVRWKRGPQRWLWLSLFVLGSMLLMPIVIYDPNDSTAAQEWVGEYGLSCYPNGRLVLYENSRFELVTIDMSRPEKGTWEYSYDDEYFIALETDGDKRIRVRLAGSSSPGFDFVTSKYGFDHVRCELNRR